MITRDPSPATSSATSPAQSPSGRVTRPLATSLATPLAIAAVAAAVLAAPALTATPAAAAIGIKTLDVKNRDRHRPIVNVRLVNGRWMFRANEKVRFNLKLYVKSKRKRMTYLAFNAGGRRIKIWQGKKTWKLKANQLRFSLNARDFAGNFGGQVARFCGEKMRGRNGTYNFKANLTFQFYILDKNGFRANRNKSIPSIIRCIS